MPLIGWAAQAPSPPWDSLAQYGVLGLGVLALGILALRMWQRETARGDRLEDENRALNTVMQDKAIPALLAAANAIGECTELLRELQRDRERDYARMRRDGDRH